MGDGGLAGYGRVLPVREERNVGQVLDYALVGHGVPACIGQITCGGCSAFGVGAAVRGTVLILPTPGGPDLHRHMTRLGVDDAAVGVITERKAAVAALSVLHHIGDEPPGSDHTLCNRAAI